MSACLLAGASACGGGDDFSFDARSAGRSSTSVEETGPTGVGDTDPTTPDPSTPLSDPSTDPTAMSGPAEPKCWQQTCDTGEPEMTFPPVTEPPPPPTASATPAVTPPPATAAPPPPATPQPTLPPPLVTDPPSSGGITYGTYTVTLSGQVSGNAFERTATLTVMPTISTTGTTNGVNDAEFCLQSGFPAATPETGAIWLGTNSGCFPTTGADLDMAYVSVEGSSANVAPDSEIAATYSNSFTASSDPIFACIYAINGGQMSAEFNGDFVDGTVEISGFFAGCGGVGGPTATYSASLAGQRTG